jgi:hypothetical protein
MQDTILASHDEDALLLVLNQVNSKYETKNLNLKTRTLKPGN